MGNGCKSLEEVSKPQFNSINKQYLKFQTIQNKQYFHYPDKFPYVLSYLRKNYIKFQDIYFSKNQIQTVYSNNKNNKKICWKRISDILPQRPISINDTLFQKYQQKSDPLPIYKLMKNILKETKDKNTIFKFQTLPQQGLILVYLPLFGSFQDPIQIVIDDYIPFNQDDTYIYPLPKDNKVGMVILDKAIAKVCGSYSDMRQKLLSQLFQMIIGVPFFYKNLASKNNVDSIIANYKPQYYKHSYCQHFQPFRSKYYRFVIDSSVIISISMLQVYDNQTGQITINNSENVVMELMKVQKIDSVYRVAYASRKWQGKTIMRNVTPQDENTDQKSQQFLNLLKGHYILHLYSLSSSSYISSNIITYSNNQINLSYRNQSNDLRYVKAKMIEGIIQKRYINAKKHPDIGKIYSRFLWDGFRGILIFKNQQNFAIKLKISIKTEYNHLIKFEQYQKNNHQLQLLQNSKRHLSFLKMTQNDVGNFYKITAQKISYSEINNNILRSDSLTQRISSLREDEMKQTKNKIYNDSKQETGFNFTQRGSYYP